MFVDIGLNLSSERYEDDRDVVMERGRTAGVTHFILTGTNLEESRTVLALARQYPGCRSTAGVHPHDASGFNTEVEAGLRELLQAPEVVAVGETGLDFNRNYSPPDAQEAALIAQLGLAAETGLPLFLHERDASARMLEILKAHKVSHGVLHCFTGNREVLWGYLDLGLMIGITGWVCDERRGLELQELVKEIPEDRLLLETDGPWLLPRDLPSPPKSKRNEPAFLPHIAARVAMLRGESLEALAAQTTANAKQIFNL
jgi:TatD DNase family protein